MTPSHVHSEPRPGLPSAWHNCEDLVRSFTVFIEISRPPASPLQILNLISPADLLSIQFTSFPFPAVPPSLFGALVDMEMAQAGTALDEAQQQFDELVQERDQLAAAVVGLRNACVCPRMPLPSSPPPTDSTLLLLLLIGVGLAARSRRGMNGIAWGARSPAMTAPSQRGTQPDPRFAAFVYTEL